MFKKWISMLLCLVLCLCAPCALAKETQLNGITMSLPADYEIGEQTDTVLVAQNETDAFIAATDDDDRIYEILSVIDIGEDELREILEEQKYQTALADGRPVSICVFTDENGAENAALGLMQLKANLLICMLLAEQNASDALLDLMATVRDDGAAAQEAFDFSALKDEYAPSAEAADQDWFALIQKEDDGFRFCGLAWNEAPETVLRTVATKTNRTLSLFNGNKGVYMGVASGSELTACTIRFEQSGGALTWDADCQMFPTGQTAVMFDVQEVYPWFSSLVRKAVKEWGEPSSCTADLCNLDGTEPKNADCTVDELLELWDEYVKITTKPKYLLSGAVFFDNLKLSVEQMYNASTEKVQTMVWVNLSQP